MALENGDPILSSSFTLSSQIETGVGSELKFGCGNSVYVMNTGDGFDGNPALTQEVAPGDPANFGRVAQLIGKGVEFRGTVIAALQVELGTSGGTGALTQCVLVQCDGFRYMATVSKVEFLT